MRIAQLLPYDADYHGGVREVVVHLSRELERLGHQVTIFGPTAHERLGLDFPRTEPIQTNPVVLPANGSVARIIGLDPRAWETLGRHLLSASFDVVHLHEPILWLPVLYVVSPGSAVIGTFHAAGELEDLGDLNDLAWPVLSGLVAHLDAGGRAGELRGYADLARPMVSSLLDRLDASGIGRLGDVARPVVGLLLARLNAAIAVSSAARSLAESYGVRVDHVIPNGVDARAFAAELGAAAAPNEMPTILFFSRLDERKGLDTLLQAMPEVLGRVPGARVVVAGNFTLSDERAQHYRRETERLAIAADFVSTPTNEEKVRLFRTATVLCAPALGQESFGIILAEAMAARLPIVASDIPGYRDVLDDGRLGILAPPGDARALADALARLLTDADLRERLASAAYPKAATLAWDVVAQRTADLYEATIRARSERRPATTPAGAGLGL
jgi:phosphatidylinositol alpha-mannosyltransferase